MSIYKRGEDVYWYKFQWDGKLIRESTRQHNDKIARNMESAHRARLASQSKDRDAARERLGCNDVLACYECEKLFNAEKAVRKDGSVFCTAKCVNAWGKARSMPTLQGFLEGRFLPDSEIRHKATPATVRYYQQGADMLIRSRLFSLRLDDLTGEHAGQFAAQFGHLSASGINRGLRTLRRALNLAYSWGQLEKPVKIELAKGEVQRDRVLTEKESTVYLAAAPQPWRDCATLIVEEGFRPGEVFALRWPHIHLGEDGTGLIRVVKGKSKAARRVLPMTQAVYELLLARYVSQGSPADGWVFPSGSSEGHLTQDAAAKFHAAALADSGVERFVPYVLRHTGLTRLGEAARGDVFALAKIGGHSTIAVTQKYIHPEAQTIYGVFSRLGQVSTKQGKAHWRVGTKLGTARIRRGVGAVGKK